MPNARFSSKCEIHAFDRDDAAFGRKSVELGKQARVQFYHTSHKPWLGYEGGS